MNKNAYSDGGADARLPHESATQLLATLTEEVRKGADLLDELARLIESRAAVLPLRELRDIGDAIDAIPIHGRLAVLEACLAMRGGCPAFAEAATELRALMARCAHTLERVRRLHRAVHLRVARRTVELSRA